MNNFNFIDFGEDFRKNNIPTLANKRVGSSRGRTGLYFQNVRSFDSKKFMNSC